MKITLSSYSRVPNLVIMNAMMEIRKFCNQLFLVHGAEERILADAVTSGPHKSEQDKSSIWYKAMLLMETTLWILTGFQARQNNLLSPKEKFYSKRFYKICRAVGTQSSVSVRWFVSLTFLRICCASNIPNMKGSMDWIPLHIRPELLITFATCRIKGFHDLENKIRRVGAWLVCSRHKCHFW